MPTSDQSILLAKNLNPKTNEETFKNFVESTKNADVVNVVFGKDGKAIAILRTAIGGFLFVVNFDTRLQLLIQKTFPNISRLISLPPER